jgi:hypothetical protein
VLDVTRRRATVVLLALAMLAGACGGTGSSRKVFDALHFPAGTVVVKRYGGDGAGQFVIAVPEPLTDSAIRFPNGFEDSTLDSYKTSETNCRDEGFTSGPRPSASCEATIVAVRRGPDPADPDDRYCRVEVDQWTDTYPRDGKKLLLARVGFVCNAPRAELGE